MAGMLRAAEIVVANNEDFRPPDRHLRCASTRAGSRLYSARSDNTAWHDGVTGSDCACRTRSTELSVNIV